MYVPYYNGDEIIFRDIEEGYSNATISSSYLYNRPWILYYPEIETGVFMIATMLIDDELKEEAQSKKVSWLRTQLAPDYPNTNNFKKFEEYNGDEPWISDIYDSNMEFDGKIINILVVKYDSGVVRIEFVYDDVLIQISYTDGDMYMNNEFVQGLTFEKIPMCNR